MPTDELTDLKTGSDLLLTHERELLKHKAEDVRSFYALTGSPRKEYAIQMAEAEGERIRITRQAEAEGILAIRKAEAEGYKLIGAALASIPNPELVIKLAALRTLHQVSQALADGQATKLFVPQTIGDIFALLEHFTIIRLR